MGQIQSHKDLRVYQLSYELAMEIFEISRTFPKEERYALTSQIRNSSRSVAANLAEAFRKRRYKRAFIAKLSDSEGESAETQTWIDFAKDCKYITPETCDDLNQKYEHVLGMLIKMIHSADQWTIRE
ncbi:MAG: four helix bundle protein [Bacteroidetes bacterium]|jgi:four helix bundle protein|nr:four helix bundle protein [Bacteroidota bacterium]